MLDFIKKMVMRYLRAIAIAVLTAIIAQTQAELAAFA